MLLGLANEAIRKRERRQASSAMEPRMVMAAMTALVYGWYGAQDSLLQITSWKTINRPTVQSHIADMCVYMRRLVLLSGG